jgi:subtilisin family serine protease
VIVELKLPRARFRPEGALESGAAVRRQRTEIADAAARLATELRGRGVVVARSWTSLPYVSLQADAATIAALEASPLVEKVWGDTAPLFPALASVVPHVGADVTIAEGHRGAGQTIVVIDDGIDRAHAFFGNRVVAAACFSGTYPALTLCPNGLNSQFGPSAADVDIPRCMSGSGNICLHGTHAAGIAAGAQVEEPGPTISGIAPDANIIAIKAASLFPACGEENCTRFYYADLLSALDYVNTVLRHVFDIAAVNMSVADGIYFDACGDHVLAEAVRNLTSHGIAVVAAAGNDGWTGATGAPACVPSAVAVGSADDPGDQLSSFGNVSPVVRLVAPGHAVESSVPGGSWSALSGTSVAAAVVTGAFAAIKSTVPGGTVQQYVDILAASGAAIADPRPGFPEGASSGGSYRRLQLNEAIDMARAELCAPTPTLGCHAADGKYSSVKMKVDTARPWRNQLHWKWKGAVGTDVFSDPTSGPSYRLCAYAGDALLSSLRIPTGGTCGQTGCWHPLAGGFRFSDGLARVDGAHQLRLKTGPAGRGQVQFKGRGASLVTPPLEDLAGGVKLQLTRDGSATCWESTFLPPFSKYDVGSWVAKGL